MPARWTCIEFPASHGSFKQSGLDELERIAPKLQVSKPFRRYSCPRCIVEGKPGWVRPSEAVAA